MPGPSARLEFVSRKNGENLSAENREILIVDLDGTLLRSDMLYESFWA